MIPASDSLSTGLTGRSLRIDVGEFRTELKTIFRFSNKVVEVPFRTLLAGHIQTTDSYASMTEENQGKRGLYQAKRGTSGDGTVPAFQERPHSGH